HPPSLSLLIPPPPRPPLFPYTTLFRSRPLMLASVADGAEGLAIADLARAVAARADAPATSIVAICRDGPRMAALARALHFFAPRSEEQTSELQSLTNLVCRLLLEKKKH